ncbi:MAG: YhbY family RNA-binding protein [Burkholderiales bacterium]
MNQLTPADRKRLKARAHHLQPVVIIGNAGLTAQVLSEIDGNLKSHELIKIRVLGDDRSTLDALLADVCEAIGASPVQRIGKILVIYRSRPPEEDKGIKQRPRRKPANKSGRPRRI